MILLHLYYVVSSLCRCIGVKTHGPIECIETEVDTDWCNGKKATPLTRPTCRPTVGTNTAFRRQKTSCVGRRKWLDSSGAIPRHCLNREHGHTYTHSILTYMYITHCLSKQQVREVTSPHLVQTAQHILLPNHVA